MDITYAFGTGDGELTEWISPADLDADGDGAVDAVLLDFDGDGLIDDAMWDADGDGAADTVRLDTTEGADAAERWFLDGAEDGTWAEETAVDADARGAGVEGVGAEHSGARGAGGESGGDATAAEASAVPMGQPGAERPAPPPESAPTTGPPAPGAATAVTADGAGRPGLLVDDDGDGAADTRLADTDGDGYLDTAGPSQTAGADRGTADPVDADPVDADPAKDPAPATAAHTGSGAGVLLGAMAGLTGYGPWGTAVP